MSYGQDTNVGISFQDSYGTAQVDSIYFIPHLTESIKVEIPPLIDESMRGVYDEGDTYEGPKMTPGELETNAQAIALSIMLRAAMGAPSTVQSGGIYTHTFKPRTSDFDSKSAGDPFTLYRYLDTGSAEHFYDLNANTFALSIANGELLKAKIGIIGGKHTQVANVAAGYPVGKRFAWDVSSVSIGGTAKPEVAELTITVDETIEAQHTLANSKWPSRNKRTGFRTIAVAGTLKFDDQTEYQAFLNQNERALIVNMRGTTEIQSGYYEEVRITAPLLRYSDFPVNADGPGQIKVGISASAKYSVDNAAALEIVVVNTQAAI